MNNILRGQSTVSMFLSATHTEEMGVQILAYNSKAESPAMALRIERPV
jgi:hypothetical protein